MHVGRDYKYEQRLRVFNPKDAWPLWLADSYRVDDVVWYQHTGLPAPPTTMTDIILQELDPVAGSFIYYNHFNLGGHDVSFGFQFQLQPAGTEVWWAGYLTLDGTQQVAPLQFLFTFGSWHAWPYQVAQWNPAPGAALKVAYDFTQAEPWP